MSGFAIKIHTYLIQCNILENYSPPRTAPRFDSAEMAEMAVVYGSLHQKLEGKLGKVPYQGTFLIRKSGR